MANTNSSNTTNKSSFQRSVQQFIIKNFLVIGLLLALIVGLAFPLPGDTLGSLKAGGYSIIKTINVCFIFFISGLTLRTSEIKSALSAYLVFAYAITAILIITPLAGYIALEIPYQPYEFAIGLAVFCVVPTTLTSGATLVMQANANYALALMVTVCSNVLGVVTVPFALKIILEGVAEGVEIDAVSLLIKLLLTILLPLLIGKAVRHSNPKVLAFGKAHKVELSMLNNGSLVMVVWQTISQSQDSIVNTKFTSILLLILSGIGLHFLYLSINFVSVKLARWEVSEQRAVMLIASQKTLPVAITIISYFGAEVGDQGLIALPCIIGHLSQLFIDSFLVARMLASDAKNLKIQQQNESKGSNSSDVEKAEHKNLEDNDDDDEEDNNSNNLSSITVHSDAKILKIQRQNENSVALVSRDINMQQVDFDFDFENESNVEDATDVEKAEHKNSEEDDEVDDEEDNDAKIQKIQRQNENSVPFVSRDINMQLVDFDFENESHLENTTDVEKAQHASQHDTDDTDDDDDVGTIDSIVSSSEYVSKANDSDYSDSSQNTRV